MHVKVSESKKSRRTVDLRLPLKDDALGYNLKRIGMNQVSLNGYLLMSYDENELMNHLIGKEVNLYELNFLARRLNSLDNYEMQKFKALVFVKEIDSVADSINLTFSLDNATLVTDFSDRSAIGKRRVLDIHGGISEEEMQTHYFEVEAERMLKSGNGQVTPFGVLFEMGWIMEKVYTGVIFPEFDDDPNVVAKVQIRCGDKEEVVDLPTTILTMDKVKGRLGATRLNECKFGVIQNSRIPDGIFEITSGCSSIEDLNHFNEMCQAIVKFDEVQLNQLQMVAEYAGANKTTEITGLSKHLYSFEINKDTHNDLEYGKFVVMESGLFEMDPLLLDYIDFEQFGKDRRESMLEESGYVSNGFVGATRSVAEMINYSGEFCNPLEVIQEELQTLRFFSPLTAELEEEDNEYDEDFRELDGGDLTSYESEILEAISRESCIGEESRGLMYYFDESKEVARKVISANPTVESYEGKLYGVLECKIKEPLTENEIDILKSAWDGQMSDGFGEGFEQRDISVDEGKLYVSFWNCSGGHFIQTEEEMKGMEQNSSMEMSM